MGRKGFKKLIIIDDLEPKSKGSAKGDSSDIKERVWKTLWFETIYDAVIKRLGQ